MKKSDTIELKGSVGAHLIDTLNKENTVMKIRQKERKFITTLGKDLKLISGEMEEKKEEVDSCDLFFEHAIEKHRLSFMKIQAAVKNLI